MSAHLCSCLQFSPQFTLECLLNRYNYSLDVNGSLANNTATPSDNGWNRYGQTEGFTDRVIIKSFSIPWSCNLLQPGATTAQIDMPPITDGWCFAYLIVSFRSSITPGGPISYLNN